MLKATLAEYIDENRIAAQYLALELLQADTTIGRKVAAPGENHLHVGGSPEFSGLSRIQATILVPSLEVIDGSPAKKSEHGILLHGRRVDRVPLSAGVEVEIFNNGTSRILLYVTEEAQDGSNPTARQEDLIIQVREDVGDLKGDVLEIKRTVATLGKQIGQCAEAIAERKISDERQDRRISKLAVGALAAIAALCLVFWASERVRVDPAISVALIAAVGAVAKTWADKNL